jgi:peptidoglycan/LPS O-acetylase OafA/YrhL
MQCLFEALQAVGSMPVMLPASEASAHRRTHRQDVDGLRAVAILSVLGYHGNSHYLPGGFVGVDIFFVISGFLISGIIFKGLQQGTFSFAAFYARRIKRIFPALLLVLACVTIFGWFALFTDEYRSLGRHLSAGAGFLSNVVLWKEASYFDAPSELKPLLHLWSLGIEEQFYLFWPPLLYLLWKRRIDPLIVIVVITLGSFALNVHWIRDHEVRTFYLPMTRLWELSLGSILALVQTPFEGSGARLAQQLRAAATICNRSWVRNVSAVVGLSLLVTAFVGLSRYQQYPGWGAVLPTLGSFLLIASGSQAWINRVLLGNPLMVLIGLISYPLYLWHWPLLSFQRIIRGGELPRGALIATLALAFVLAWLTYRLVERPVRSSRKRLAPSMILLQGAVLIATIGYLSLALEIQPRSARFGLERIIAASAKLAYPGPHLRQLGGVVNPILEQGDNREKVLFLGDSEVEQYYPRIDWLLTEDPEGTKSVIYSSRGGCPPFPNVRENQLPQCDGLIEQGIELAKDPNISTIVVAADWAGYFLGTTPDHLPYYYEDASTRGLLGDTMRSAASKKAFLAFEAMVSQFTKANKKVYIVLPSTTGEMFEPRSMITRTMTDFSFRIRIPTIRTSNVVAQLHPVVARLREIAAHTGALTIDPIAALCNDSVCPVLTAGGEPIHKDDSHLNPAYVVRNVYYLDSVVMRISDRFPSGRT